MPETTSSDQAGEYRDASQPKYLESIQDAISDRSTWNKKDTLIMKRRLGERKTSRRKYRSAPEPVVPIIDDTVRERSEQEISMIMNAPKFAYFINLNPSTPESITRKAEVAFDTFVRHYMDYRRVKDEEVDTKNARGFAVTKLIRIEHETLGVIPSAVSVDPKDIIVPSNTKSPKKAPWLTHVLRYSIRDLKDKKTKGWKNINALLSRLGVNNDYDTIGTDGSSTGTTNSPATTYSSSEQETNPLRATENLIGLNTSNVRGGQIVVWEVYHPADDWDVANDWTGKVEKGKPCMTYICPDQPDILLNIKAWKYEDKIEVVDVVDEMGAVVQQTVVTEEGKWRPCPYVQHRFENRSKWWYDTRGLGHLNMDNQLIASGLEKRHLQLADYYSNPVFTNDGTGGTNPTNVRLDVGNVLPKGIKPAVMPTPPPTLDFSVDKQKREASLRSGAGTSLFSAEMSATRKVQKSATEIASQEAQRSMLSSAGVDRFNDSDKELFAMIWADLRELQVELPLISNNATVGQPDASIYDHEFLIIPASSQKTLNPDAQFNKWSQVMNMMSNALQFMPNQDIEAQFKHGLAYYDPHYADIAIIDGNAQNGGQPPIYQQLDQMKQMMAELGDMVKQIGGLATENADKLEKADNAGEDKGNGVPPELDPNA